MTQWQDLLTEVPRDDFISGNDTVGEMQRDDLNEKRSPAGKNTVEGPY